MKTEIKREIIFNYALDLSHFYRYFSQILTVIIPILPIFKRVFPVDISRRF